MLDFYAIFVSWILYAGVHAQCQVRVIAYDIWHVCGFGCQLWLETSYMEVYVLESTCLNGFAFGCTSLWQKFVYNFRVPTLYVLRLFVKYIAVDLYLSCFDLESGSMHRQITQLLLFSIVSMQKEQANSFVFKTFPNCRYFSIISILTKKCSGLFFCEKV